MDRGESRAPPPPGATYEQTHTTRMVPKRVDELLDGGSLYWVIKGQVACRQSAPRHPAVHGHGRHRPLPAGAGPKVVPVEPRPYRPFQGWRYLVAKDAPRDIDLKSGDLALMPDDMRRELAELGLL